MSEITPSIFRAYDIRGIVDDTLTEQSVELIGRAIGSEAAERGERSVIVARDGRHSGQRLQAALIKGLTAAGRDVVNIGMVPTPVLYYATNTLGDSTSGVMVTGSHNPPEYNGYKVYWTDGGQIVPPQDAAIVDEINNLSFEEIKFNAKQFHFHSPSEHTYNGKYFDLEMHTVHLEDQGKPGGFMAAALGVAIGLDAAVEGAVGGGLIDDAAGGIDS